MLAPRWYYLEQDMKNTVIKFAAIAGLLTAMASPANAEHSAPGFVVRSGPVYVSYKQAYRRDYAQRRYDRDYYHRRSHQKRHHKQHHRAADSHDRWHWSNSGRWDRYYYYDHSDLHYELRHGHRDSHRRNDRHR